MAKTKFCIFFFGFLLFFFFIFLVFFFLIVLTLWRHSGVTWKLMVLILVHMDRIDQGLYIGTKYNIIDPLSWKIYGGLLCNNPMVRYDTKNKETNKQPGR